MWELKQRKIWAQKETLKLWCELIQSLHLLFSYMSQIIGDLREALSQVFVSLPKWPHKHYGETDGMTWGVYIASKYIVRENLSENLDFTAFGRIGVEQ